MIIADESGGPDIGWEEKVKAEASQLAGILFSNFKHCMNLCIAYAPDQTDPKQRARVFELVVQGFLGAAVNPIATFGNTTKEIEDLVVSEIRLKFEWIRGHEKELHQDRLDRIAEDRKAKSGLIIAPAVKE